MTALRKRLLPILVLAAGVGIFAALKASRPAPPPTQPTERAWKIEVREIRIAPASPVLVLHGTVESPRLMKAAAPATGRIASVSVREGDAVYAGRVLLRLDSRDLDPRVESAQADVRELTAQRESEALRAQSDHANLASQEHLLQLARDELARQQSLRDRGFLSDAALDAARQSVERQRLAVESQALAVRDHAARLAAIEARRARAGANLDQARRDQERGTVVAPFTGFVASVSVAQGDQVQSGQALLTLYPSGDLEVRAKIPAPYQDEVLAALRDGQRPAAYASIAGETATLHLARVSGQADARGLDAFFRIEAGRAVPRLGTLLTLRMERQQVADAMALPYAALYGGGRVYKVEQDRLVAVPVTLLGEDATARPDTQGSRGGTMLVRSPGLKAGDRVMATHLPNAVTGLKVETDATPSRPARAGAAGPSRP